MIRLLYVLLLCGWLTAPAAAQLADLVDSTATSPTYFLDLGNREFAADRPGYAILAYERGLRLRPGHAALTNNLAFVRQEAGLDERPPTGFFLLRWWRMAGALIGATTSFVLAQLLWWAAVALGGYWWVRRERMDEKRRFALLPAAVGLALLAALFFGLGRSRNADLHDRTAAVVVTPGSDLRVAPEPTASLEDELRAGLTLRVVDTFGEFTKVVLPDGRQGWLPNDDLEII